MLVFLGFLCGLFLGAGPTQARADDVSAALEQESKAYSDYYQGLKQLGTTATPEQKEALRARTVGAAKLDVDRAVGKAFAENEKATRQNVWSYYKELFESGIPEWVKNPLKASATGSATATPESTESAGPKRESTPEPTIEEYRGTAKGPEQLVFKGKGKVGAKPSPLPSVDEYRARMKNGKALETQQLVFPGKTRPSPSPKPYWNLKGK